MRANVNTYPLHPGKMVPVTFPERLEALVAAASSQRQVAKRLGVSHTQLARYLEGQQPTLERAADIADRLGLTLDELAGREPARSRKPRVVAIDGVLYQAVTEPRAAGAGRSATSETRHVPEPDAAAGAMADGMGVLAPPPRGRRTRRTRTDEGQG